MSARSPASRPFYDRAFLLHGPERDEILTLDEVRQYATDSFSDAGYLSLYGLKPDEWYGRAGEKKNGPAQVNRRNLSGKLPDCTTLVRKMVNHWLLR